MKYILFLVMLLFIRVDKIHSQVKDGYATITIDALQLKDTIVNITIGTEQPTDLEIPMKYEESQMKNGHFRKKIMLKGPTTIALIVADHLLFSFPCSGTLFEPKDDITIQISDMKRTGLLDLRVSGRGSGKIRLLQNAYSPVYREVKKQKSMFEIPLSEYLRNQIKLNQISDSAFQANQNLVSKTIFEILDTRMKSDRYISLFHVLARKLNEDSVISVYQKYIPTAELKKIFTKPGILNYLSYAHFELNYLPLLDYGVKNRIPVDLVSLRDLPKYYQLISEYYSEEPTIRNHLLAETLVNNLKAKALDADLITYVERFLKEVRSGTLYNQVLQRYELTKKNKTVGAPFYNFELRDNNNKLVQLSDFKGKLVLLDFYFNGCGACRLLVPIMKKIEEKYHGKNIAFISISVDQTKELWKKGQGIFSSPKSIQLYTDNKGIKDPLIIKQGIQVYPTLFLLDKEGKIINPNLSPYEKEIDIAIEKAFELN